jgi:hypothetical protein
VLSSRKSLLLFATVLLTSCGAWSEQAGSGSVIARSNEMNVGNDSADLQAAAFEILSGATREDAIVLLERQGFRCTEGHCTYVREYRDSYWSANLGVGQRERLPGSRLNKRLESTTVYTISIRATRISQIDDIKADVSSMSNYD